MRIYRTHKCIYFNKSIGNMKITSHRICIPNLKTEKSEHYTEIHCWYDRNCEDCPMGWEESSYEGECEDCGCLFNYSFDVPIWKCMLPRWIKRIIIKLRIGSRK